MIGSRSARASLLTSGNAYTRAESLSGAVFIFYECSWTDGWTRGRPSPSIILKRCTCTLVSRSRVVWRICNFSVTYVHCRPGLYIDRPRDTPALKSYERQITSCDEPEEKIKDNKNEKVKKRRKINKILDREVARGYRIIFPYFLFSSKNITKKKLVTGETGWPWSEYTRSEKIFEFLYSPNSE